jgi:WD40 repeat protein
VREHNFEGVIPAPRGPLALLTANPNRRSLSGDERQFRVWDTESGKVLHEFGARHELWNRRAAAWSPDGRHLLLERFEIQRHKLSRSYLVLWDAVEGKLVRSFADRPRIRGVLGPIALCLAFSGDGAQAVSVDWDGSFRRWEVATGKELTSVKFDKSGALPGILALSKDGASAVSDRREVLDTATGKVVQTLEETPWERPPWESGGSGPNRSVKGQ